MNKLYRVFGLQEPNAFRRQQKARLYQLRNEGQFTKAEFAEFKRDKRRTGKTVNLVVKAIDLWLQGKRVVVRAGWNAQVEDIRNYIKCWMPTMLTHSNFHLLRGTRSGVELLSLGYDIVLDDEPEMFRVH